MAIIPARGGSKGLPRKNAMMLAGMPLVAHSIHAAKAARHIGRIVVSTDDPEIGAIAETHGAEVVWRPAEISGDLASSEAALIHTLEHYKEAQGVQPALTVFLQCTSPLTAGADIDGTVDALLAEKADTALAAIDFHYFLWRTDDAGNADGVNHDKRVRLMRQQRTPEFLETGAVYVMRTAGFLEHRHRFFGRTALYPMPADRRWEIDEPADLEVAEVLLRRQQTANRASLLPAPVQAVVMDFDGVLTDNRVLLSEQGFESVACHRGDGLGLAMLRDSGLPMCVLSSEVNPVVTKRCEKLKLTCEHGLTTKGENLKRWLTQNGIDARRTVYIGNDVNDLDCMAMVGCAVCPADAHPAVRQVSRIVLNERGGYGAVRELADLILEQSSQARQPT